MQPSYPQVQVDFQGVQSDQLHLDLSLDSLEYQYDHTPDQL